MDEIQIESSQETDWEWIQEKHAETAWACEPQKAYGDAPAVLACSRDLPTSCTAIAVGV